MIEIFEEESLTTVAKLQKQNLMQHCEEKEKGRERERRMRSGWAKQHPIFSIGIC